MSYRLLCKIRRRTIAGQPVSYNFGIAIGSFIGSAVQEGWGFRPLGLPAAMFALAALGLNLLLLRANGRRTAAAAS